MIKIELKRAKRIENETGLMCLDDCIATLAGYYDCEYELMYIDGYQMVGQKGCYDFASRYKIYVVNRFKNLFKYHGLEIIPYAFWSKRQCTKKLIKSIKQNNPVMVQFNPYWCPWDDGYQIYDASPGHNFIVVGVEDNNLICVDPYFDKKEVRLSFEMFYKGIQEIYIVEYKQTIIQESEDISKLLVNMFYNMRKNGYFHFMRCFLEDAEMSDDLFYDVKEDNNLWISDFVIILLQINQSIQNIAIVTEYVGTKCEESKFFFSSEKIWNLAIQWRQARKLIFKLFFLSSTNRDIEKLKKRTIQRMVDAMTSLEKISWDISDRKKFETQTLTISNHARNYSEEICIELEQYMNNRAFLNKNSIDTDILTVDFSSVGTGYLIDDECINKTWELNKIKFLLTNLGKKNFDNIACDGQKIWIKEGIYKKIAIVGAAEFGETIDFIKLVFSNGDNCDIPIQFTDYVLEPRYNEKIFWKGEGFHRLENGYEIMKENVYLYEQEYNLPYKIIKGIILPINPRLHIFAVTLT